MKYEYYQFIDFIADEYFIRWVLSPDKNSDLFWQNWLQNHPEKVKEVIRAREYIVSLNQHTDQWTVKESFEVWDKIEQDVEQIDQQENNFKQRRYLSEKRNSVAYFWRVAATLLLVMSVTFILKNFYGGENIIIRQTGYGEIKNIVLPDSTIITLNSNSRISYSANLDQELIRDINLEGEAYFSVYHTIDNRKFIVTTSNMNIEVLGTEFNVNSRRNQTEVVLNSGKIEIAAEHNKDTTRLILQPGELVQISSEDPSMVKKQVNPYKYSAWRDNKLILDSTPIQDVVRNIEDNYGVDIIIYDKDLSDRKITGTIVSDNLDVLLKALSATSNIEVVKENNQIILKDKYIK